jgi:thioredoxin reductase (NADPH)
MNKIYDILVVGSGPAGLTAGIYAVRGGASALLVAGEVWGGQLMLTTLVENYPGFPDGIQGPDLMHAMRSQAEKLGVLFVDGSVTDVRFDRRPFEIYSLNDKYLARSVVIATGAQALWLGVKGEKELVGRGVSSCAPCDAAFFKDKRVAVVGGGDSAMEEALVLTKFAKDVTIIHRRDQFKASKIMQERALSNPKIKVLWNSEVIEVVGKDKLEKLILKDRLDGKTREFVVDGLFVAIGHAPSTEIFAGKVELDEKGFVKKMERDGYNMATSVDGVFVAGDVHDHHYKQAVTAAGYGCMAALDAIRYLDNNV